MFSRSDTGDRSVQRHFISNLMGTIDWEGVTKQKQMKEIVDIINAKNTHIVNIDLFNVHCDISKVSIDS